MPNLLDQLREHTAAAEQAERFGITCNWKKEMSINSELLLKVKESTDVEVQVKVTTSFNPYAIAAFELDGFVYIAGLSREQFVNHFAKKEKMTS
ncbi:hypothetical protein [Sediminibacillus terrae]|uniref:hypothetical protein n=1 Tax=Sediminibacillus terrae TaxID=1562106 RepID=UPI00129756A4|nr:hypothetical protein [Sediminibacillus terrae]